MLALAKQGGHTLVCGDRRLRGLSEAEGVICYGVLWVLDQNFDVGSRSKGELAEALKVTVADPRWGFRARMSRNTSRYSKK